MMMPETSQSNYPSARIQAILALTQSIVPSMTAILGGLWVIFTYLDNQAVQADRQRADIASREADLRQQNNIRQFEARKPFLEKQLELYLETAKVAGRLVTVDYKKPEWVADSDRFWQLFWTELSVVEDDSVKAAMEEFGRNLEGFGSNPGTGTQRVLRDSSYKLAQAIRASIDRSWRIGPQ